MGKKWPHENFLFPPQRKTSDKGSTKTNVDYTCSFPNHLPASTNIWISLEGTGVGTKLDNTYVYFLINPVRSEPHRLYAKGNKTILMDCMLNKTSWILC